MAGAILHVLAIVALIALTFSLALSVGLIAADVYLTRRGR